jgi:outer membrane protein OmpA-like peptidoglycan-associated protein
MKLSYYQFISGFLSLCVTVSVSANIVEYGQKLNEADWKVQSNKKGCFLSQVIPLYGKAEFKQKYSDTNLEFNIYVNRYPVKVIKGNLTSIPPQWNHITLLRPIGRVQLKTNNKSVSLNLKLSLRVISELEEGMFPTLSYQSWSDKRNDIQVSISPVNFRENLPKFIACIAKLPSKPVVVVKPKPKPKPKPIKVTVIEENTEPNTVFFAANSSTLKAKAKKKLKLLVKKLKKNKKTKHIIVSGYSDDAGNKTQSTAISKQRALVVQGYLEQLGIPAKYLFTRYFGRDHAILSNKTAKGRAKNRRVHIDVIESNLKLER